MADEITFNSTIQVQNGLHSDKFSSGRIQVDQAAQGFWSSIMSIATSEETVTLTDITTEGVCVIYNLDTTNYVQVGFSTAVYGIRLPASHIPAVFNCEPGLTLYMKANTAACEVLVKVYEA